MTTLLSDQFNSPCGPISLVFNDKETLLHLDFPDQGNRQDRLLTSRFGTYHLRPKATGLREYILAYLSGEMTALDNIPCDLGGTPFQQTVWAALRTIPCGETISYKELALSINKPKAVRAVARANALNPISLVYPCHRVIGSNGKLIGYAGGLERKAWLLRHEQKT